jgi:hypothetical protein
LGLDILSCVYLHPWWFDSYGLTWERMQRWKLKRYQRRKKGKAFLSLYFGLMVFTHELIALKQIIFLLITWGQATSERNAQISHYWPQDLLRSTLSLKHAWNANISHYWPQDLLCSTLSLKHTWDKASTQDISKDKGLGQGVSQFHPQFWECPQLVDFTICKAQEESYHEPKHILDHKAIFASTPSKRLRGLKSGKDLRGVLHQLPSIRSLPFLPYWA